MIRYLKSGLFWTIIGVILAIVSLVYFGISQYRSQRRFDIAVDDDFSIIEVREQLEDLRILYRGADLLSTGKEIRLLRITLRNTGTTILQNEYDQNQQFGLLFPGSTILRASAVNSNSNYLKANIITSEQPTSVEQSPEASSRLQLNKLIFEPDKFVAIQLYLLRERTTAGAVAISAIGKIAGLDEIPVVRSQQDRTSGSRDAWSSPALLFGGYIAVIVLSLSVIFIAEAIGTRQKRKRIAKFLSHNLALSPGEQSIINLYQNNWSYVLEELLQNVSAHDAVVDLRDLVKDQADRILRRYQLAFILPISLRRIRALATIPIPEALFERDGYSIRLAKENKEFVRRFFTEMGVLRVN